MVSMDQASTKVSDLKIFIKDVRDRQGKKRPITVRPWSTVKDVKDQLQRLLHIPPSAQRLYFGPLLVSNKELPNYRTLHDAGIYKSGEILFLDIKGMTTDDAINSSMSAATFLRSSANDICISSSMLDDTPRAMRKIVQQARRGLMMGFKPDLVLDGTGGTYFLHDARKAKIAVFKPGDEEPYAENNPRGYVRSVSESSCGFDDETMREGVMPGESCLREVAAYLLDHDGFSGVPMTTLAEARHPAFNTNETHLKLAEGSTLGTLSLTPTNDPVSQLAKKVGSIQEFVRAEYSMDDLSPSKLSVDEVHKIAVLDIRLMNADRNGANLLCRRKPDNSLELVPIDHGYCLRSVCDVAWFDWCWLDWPQLKEPMSTKTRNYIINLDIESDICLLKERLNIGTEALDNFRASSKILQVGTQMGLSLYDIAIMCCRNDNEGIIQSDLEKITFQAAELSKAAVENGKWHHTSASQAIEEQLQIINMNGIDLFSPVMKLKAPLYLPSLSNEIVPNRMLTSGSESSGEDLLEQGNEECDIWAASVLAEVNADTSHFKTRSISIESNISDSSDESKAVGSPKGFWVVKPSAEVMDNDQRPWSPSSSPIPSFILDKPKMATQVSYLSSGSSTVSFNDSGVIQNISSLQKKPSMVRSQSFSAISSRKSDTCSPSMMRRTTTYTKKIDEDYKQYHKYFLKFISLLIERKTRLRSLEI